MLDFLRRHKIKNREALRKKLVQHHRYTYIPHHDDEEFDRTLPSLLTMEMLSSGGFDSHFEPITDSDPADNSPAFVGGGGDSGGAGAVGSWDPPADTSSSDSSSSDYSSSSDSGSSYDSGSSDSGSSFDSGSSSDSSSY